MANNLIAVSTIFLEQIGNVPFGELQLTVYRVTGGSMNPEQVIKQKIAARREAILKLDRDRERLLNDIAAFEELLSEMVPSTPAETSPPQDEVEEDEHDGTEGRQLRGLSPRWRAVMKRLMTPTVFGYDDFVAAATKVGIDIDRARARPRVFKYIEAGYLIRVGDGMFSLTQKARDAAE